MNTHYSILNADTLPTELPELGFELTFSPTNLISPDVKYIFYSECQKE